MTKEESDNLTPLKTNLLIELEKCIKIILGEGFKLRWTEHFVDVLRAVNTLIRIFTNSLEEETKLKIL
jgi:hypothetical protein